MVEGAMNMETELLLASLRDPKEYMYGKWRFVEGKYNNMTLVIAITSIGMVNAAASTALGIEKFQPEAVISQGTAGGHDPALKAFDIVIGAKSFDASAYRSAKEIKADWRHIELMGAYAYEPSAQKFVPQAVYYPANSKLLLAAEKTSKSYSQGKVITGCIASCNTWNRQQERIKFLHDEFGSSCEDMEVNSAAQICKQYNIPFLGIRIISNTEFNDEEFQPQTAAVCQRFVLKVIDKL